MHILCASLLSFLPTLIFLGLFFGLYLQSECECWCFEDYVHIKVARKLIIHISECPAEALKQGVLDRNGVIEKCDRPGLYWIADCTYQDYNLILVGIVCVCALGGLTSTAYFFSRSRRESANQGSVEAQNQAGMAMECLPSYLAAARSPSGKDEMRPPPSYVAPEK
ncbi:hypothetical protein BDZ88DRAFT_124956 [Geranomyces variabilis]|nr:hypothetical protein BDZ88DRAFT_124956 [Geranomyces variabilis]KAJ3131687.1 hypothetical protein HDU90_008139 [Geranomyces variabilis]